MENSYIVYVNAYFEQKEIIIVSNKCPQI